MCLKYRNELQKHEVNSSEQKLKLIPQLFQKLSVLLTVLSWLHFSFSSVKTFVRKCTFCLQQYIPDIIQNPTALSFWLLTYKQNSSMR